MILWHKIVKLQGGGTVEITLRGEIEDPVEFWNSPSGKLIVDLAKLVRAYERLSLPAKPDKQENAHP